MSTQPVGSKRAKRGSTRTTTPTRLGAGLVEIPTVPLRDPAEALLPDPRVPEERRYCANCGRPVGRAHDGDSPPGSGRCPHCGVTFSFEPRLSPGDVVAGQYEVAGCIAHGGMGWVYLAHDRNVSDRWVVLKGLLNASDEDAVDAALAERRFLAEVEHPNVVKIYNFVQHESAGYIVMEYVGGRSLKQILDARREARGGVADPLAPAQAIAYVLEILPALGHLHELGLAFCDFKLDNVIQTRHDLKLIDLGGVYRLGDESAAIFGTVGYQAPEVAYDGPSVASDLFTVARALALMCFDFTDYQGAMKFDLPARGSVPVFERFDSLYRLLRKGTARDADDRFQSAQEMADQLYGVLREVVAADDGRTVHAQSALFTAPLRPHGLESGWRELPRPQVEGRDPAAGYLATLTAGDTAQLVAQLRGAPEETIEVRLRIAAAMIDAEDWQSARDAIASVENEDRWEWRAGWYRGLLALAMQRPADARDHFIVVYHALPGELAPKLALGLAAEQAEDFAGGARWYAIVARTDPSYTSAAFGLASCRIGTGDRAGALAAYAGVPDTSSSYIDARIATVRCLAGPDVERPEPDELLAAGAIVSSLDLDNEQRLRLTAELLESGLRIAPVDCSDELLLGARLTEHDLRMGLERVYRALARGAQSPAERIELVDRANQARPRSWT